MQSRDWWESRTLAVLILRTIRLIPVLITRGRPSTSSTVSLERVYCYLVQSTEDRRTEYLVHYLPSTGYRSTFTEYMRHMYRVQTTESLGGAVTQLPYKTLRLRSITCNSPGYSGLQSKIDNDQMEVIDTKILEAPTKYGVRSTHTAA